jgi:hypothetical protein
LTGVFVPRCSDIVMEPVTLSLGQRKPVKKATPLASDDGSEGLHDSESHEEDEPVTRAPKRRLTRERPSRVVADSDDDESDDDGGDDGDDETDEEEGPPVRKKAAVEGEKRSRMLMVAVEGTFRSLPFFIPE